MKKWLVLFFVLFGYNCGVCMEQYPLSVFEPSELGRVYNELSKSHLVNRWLDSSEMKKAAAIIKKYDLAMWDKQIKTFEFDDLFPIAILLCSLGGRDMATEMIYFAYEKGYRNNFVINRINGTVNKKTIAEALNNLKLNS